MISEASGFGDMMPGRRFPGDSGWAAWQHGRHGMRGQELILLDAAKGSSRKCMQTRETVGLQAGEEHGDGGGSAARRVWERESRGMASDGTPQTSSRRFTPTTCAIQRRRPRAKNAPDLVGLPPGKPSFLLFGSGDGDERLAGLKPAPAEPRDVDENLSVKASRRASPSVSFTRSSPA